MTRPSCSSRTASSLREKGFEVECRHQRRRRRSSCCAAAVRPRAPRRADAGQARPRGLSGDARARADPPVVMVTKSEEDSTLTRSDRREHARLPREAGQSAAGARRWSRACSKAPRIRQQAVARAFVERFRAMELERGTDLDWRGWIDALRRARCEWDVDLAAARRVGLHESLRGLYPDMRREFAQYMRDRYPAWLANLEGDRPPLSIDIVSEFLAAGARARTGGGLHRHRLPAARPVARARAVARAVSSMSRRRTTSRAARRRRRTRGTRCSAGSFPARSPRASPTGGASARTRSLNAHERELLEAHLAELRGRHAGALREDLDGRRLRRPRAAHAERRSPPRE